MLFLTSKKLKCMYLKQNYHNNMLQLFNFFFQIVGHCSRSSIWRNLDPSQIVPCQAWVANSICIFDNDAIIIFQNNELATYVEHMDWPKSISNYKNNCVEPMILLSNQSICAT